MSARSRDSGTWVAKAGLGHEKKSSCSMFPTFSKVRNPRGRRQWAAVLQPRQRRTLPVLERHTRPLPRGGGDRVAGRPAGDPRGSGGAAPRVPRGSRGCQVPSPGRVNREAPARRAALGRRLAARAPPRTPARGARALAAPAPAPRRGPPSARRTRGARPAAQPGRPAWQSQGAALQAAGRTRGPRRSHRCPRALHPRLRRARTGAREEACAHARADPRLGWASGWRESAERRGRAGGAAAARGRGRRKAREGLGRGAGGRAGAARESPAW